MNEIIAERQEQHNQVCQIDTSQLLPLICSFSKQLSLKVLVELKTYKVFLIRFVQDILIFPFV